MSGALEIRATGGTEEPVVPDLGEAQQEHYPQSNGKLERVNKPINEECIRPGGPLSLDDAKQLVGTYVAHYHTVRLHSAMWKPLFC